MTYWEALYFIRKQRSIVQPNMGFAKQLQDYEQALKKSKLLEEYKTQFKPTSPAKYESASMASKLYAEVADQDYQKPIEARDDAPVKPIQYSSLSLKTSIQNTGSTKLNREPALTEKDILKQIAAAVDADYQCSHCKIKLFASKDIVPAHEPLD